MSGVVRRLRQSNPPSLVMPDQRTSLRWRSHWNFATFTNPGCWPVIAIVRRPWQHCPWTKTTGPDSYPVPAKSRLARLHSMASVALFGDSAWFPTDRRALTAGVIPFQIARPPVGLRQYRLDPGNHISRRGESLFANKLVGVDVSFVQSSAVNAARAGAIMIP